MIVARRRLLKDVEHRLTQSPVVLLLGPRQCGKRTLAREIASARGNIHLFDLERPADQSRLQQPMSALEPLRGLVLIDEAQLRPDLFPILRVLADRPDQPARFLLTGSASPEMIRGSSESLAGRAALIYMSGFTLDEIGGEQIRPLWLRGGFPRSFLAPTDADSFQWRQDFIQLFLERDLRNFGVQVPAATMRRFWIMLAHYHGQIWNGSEIARSIGLSASSVRHYLDILSGAFVVRQLQPWFDNSGKRIVKSPKIYITDSGILHGLMGLSDFASLESHPKLGASWEGFVIQQVLACMGDRDAYFWATHGGAELDLLFLQGGKKFGIEIKYADAPTMARSIHVALEDLQLERLWIIYPGSTEYKLHDRVTVMPLAKFQPASGTGF